MSQDAHHTEQDAPQADALPLHRIDISVGPSPMSAEVLLDGKRWLGLKSITFAVGPGEAVEVTAKFWANIHGRFEVKHLEGATLGRRAPNGAVLATPDDNGASPE